MHFWKNLPRSILKNWNAKNVKGFESWLITCISQYGANCPDIEGANFVK
jgi:hypothetical protein